MSKCSRYNGSRCFDLTAQAAIDSADMASRKKRKQKLSCLIKDIHALCEVAGFSVEKRIVLKDLESGEIFK